MTGATRRGVIGRLVVAAAASILGLAARGRTVRATETTPQRWICTYNECEHWVWDPLHGDPPDVAGRDPVPPGVRFEDLPEDWRCPVCGSPKVWFEPTDEPWRPMA